MPVNTNPINVMNQPNYQYQQQTQPQQNPNQIISERVWVEGESGGKGYLVGRGHEQVLWDIEAPVIYIKTVDASGRPHTVTLDYTIRPDEEQVQSNELARLKDDFNDLKKQMIDFMNNFNQNNQQKNSYKQNYRKERNND